MEDRLYNVLLLIPPFLHHINDLNALLSTSKRVRQTIQQNLKPLDLFLILFRSRDVIPERVLFGYTVDGLSRWLGRNVRNRKLYMEIIPFTPGSMVRLNIVDPTMIVGSSLTLTKVQNTFRTRMEIANRLTDLFDRCVGEQWYDVPDFWDGGRQDAATLWAEPEKMVLLMGDYGEMFKEDIDGWYWSTARVEVDESDLDDELGHKNVDGSCGSEISLRMEWVKYNFPDWLCDLRWEGYRCGVESEYTVHPSHFDIENYAFGSDTLNWLKKGDETGEVNRDTSSQRDRGSVHGGDERDLENEPSDHQPIHPLRRIRKQGIYESRDTLGTSENVQSLLHLVEKSPLFNKITRRIRQRVIRLALHGAPDRVGGDETGREFGESIFECGEMQTHPTWKQVLWEDTLFSSGWQGLELIADEWEWDEENTKSALRRQERDRSGISIKENDGMKDHPFIQNLAKRYKDIKDLERRPDVVTLKSTAKKDRLPVQNFTTLPCFITDLRMAIWHPFMGQSWVLRS